MAGNDYSMIAMILAIISAISFIMAGVLLFTVTSAVEAYYGVGGMITMLAILSIISGVVVLIGGMMIKKPSTRMVGSILALVFGIVGFFGGGGLLLTGTILGIVAGVLGLVSKS
jgi:hypothetical protein